MYDTKATLVCRAVPQSWSGIVGMYCWDCQDKWPWSVPVNSLRAGWPNWAGKARVHLVHRLNQCCFKKRLIPSCPIYILFNLPIKWHDMRPEWLPLRPFLTYNLQNGQGTTHSIELYYTDEKNNIGVLTNNQLKVCSHHIPFQVPPNRTTQNPLGQLSL